MILSVCGFLMQSWQETDKAAYLLRQYFFNNLHDRLSTRPFPSLVEKKWLAFQLLLALRQCHEKGVCHGDIKCENVLVTSWNWLYLADFASFKPTYIPYDDPSDFSFFFDSGGRRLCYLAPERFYEHGGEMQVAQDAPLKPSMDIFAVGCVIAELFLEGQPLFELSQLLAYRRGQYDPSQHLEKIPDCGIRKMILHMIQLEPESRLSAESYLQNYAGVVFPTYFSPFLHNFYCCCNPLPPDARVAMCQSAFNEILKHMMDSRLTVNETLSGAGCGNESLEIVEKKKECLMVDKSSVRNLSGASKNDKSLLRNGKENDPRSRDISQDMKCSGSSKNFRTLGHPLGNPVKHLSGVYKENGCRFLKKITVEHLNDMISEYDVQFDTFSLPIVSSAETTTRCEGMVLIASLLCSCIRNVKLPHLRRCALVLLRSCSHYIDDEDRLQRILPYVIAMLSDPAAIVRSAAVETLCDILSLVRDFPPSDAKIFPEYILPMLSMLPEDPEESVRICYASNIAKLAVTAFRFLIRSISLSQEGVLDELNLQQRLPPTSNDSQLAHLRKSIAEVVQELVMGPKQTPSIRRALLQDIAILCSFFGQRQSNDFLLPVLPAFLNDRDEQLRAVFYGQIIYVCFFVGERSVEEYLLPYIEQALNDLNEAVVVNALECLTILCRSSFLRKRILLEMIERAFPLLCYPSQWVRGLAVTFISASSENLGAVDSFVFLVPLIRPFLRRQPASLASEKVLLSCLKPPVSKDVFCQVLENSRSSDMLERQRKIWYNSPAQFKHRETTEPLIKGSAESSNLTKTWADKLRDIENQNSIESRNPCGQMKSEEGAVLPMSMGSLTRKDTPPNKNLYSEKLQFSGIMSSHMNGMNTFICNKASDGFPVYSFSMDRRAAGNTSGGPASSFQISNSLGFDSSNMPWIDTVSKSFTLGSTVPVQKLVSGSFSITNGSKQFYRVVHEPEGRESEQTTAYVTGKFQELGLSDSVKGSSLNVEDASTPADLLSLSSLSRLPSIPDSGWRPRGVLVAHLQEHRSAVNDIAVSSDHSFFVTASDDSTVKIWDSRKLEKDISFRSRLTYHLEGSRALCTTMPRGSAQVVVGADDGIVHIFSVDYISKGLGNVVEKYSGIADIKKKDIKEGAILTLLNYSPDNSPSATIIFSTQSGRIHLLDVRNNINAWTLKTKPEEGYLSSLVTGPCGNWFVSGSSRGVLTLWDLRFLVPVNSWQYSISCPIEKMCLFVPSNSASVSTTTRPLVYVAAGCNEISLWNAENGSCHQVLKVSNYDGEGEASDIPSALAKPPNKSNSRIDLRRNVNPKYRVDELNEPPPRLPGIRSLLPLPGGDLLTGGTDLRVRRWNHKSPEQNYCVCGPNVKGAGNDFYETRSCSGVQVVQETRRRPLTTKLTAKTVIAAAATDSAGCHRDSILSLASVKLNQRFLLSSSRDGAVKVWK
ncbi:hypothetical protein SAY86_026651 [Trapa natans]|uniref:non-specific serine/threonine protein kinase n=1 Tax=Trapa natans TaxID=22666 RepID=A0AAN7KK47_TRANT|nr:hypothetical protein SAY86_026651 [Trapa natans]